MEVPVFSITERSQLQGPPMLGIGACVKGRVSGTLTVQTDKIVRQFQWSQGHCVGTLSNAKSELPGSFLLGAGKLTKNDYEAYLTAIRVPKADPWKLAVKTLSLPEPELVKLKAAYAARLASEFARVSNSVIQFQPAPQGVASPWISGVRLLIDALAEAPVENVREVVRDLLPTSSVFLELAQEKNLSPLPLSAEENGLLTVIRNNDVVSEVFSSSFLGADRITRLLAALWFAGLIRLENAQTTVLRKHEGGLTEDHRKVIKELRERVASLNRTTYYQRLGAQPDAKIEMIQTLFQKEIERLTSPELPKLFLGDEKKLPEKLIHALKEAFSVLSNAAQRKEYDSFLASGSGGGSGSFGQVSVVQREEKWLAEADRLKREGAVRPYIDLLKKGVEEIPESATLIAVYARAVLDAGLQSDPNVSEHVVANLKRALQFKPPAAGTFEVLGAWMERAGQQDKALEAYRRAAEIAPFSSGVREGLTRLAPEEANSLVVQVIHRNLSRLNHYELLGLDVQASPKEIQTAYRECTKRFHPDRFFKSNDPAIKATANEVYKAMVRAYTTLKSATKRGEYDAGPKSHPQSTMATAPTETLTAPKHPQAKKFLELALQALRQGKKDTAVLNLKLGLQIEPQNGLLQAKLKEIS